MKLTIRCIGQEKQDDFNKYRNRLKKPFSIDLNISPHSKAKDIKQQKSEEAKNLLKNLPNDSFLIATCINGQNISTEDLANKIFNYSKAILFIGGCNGLDQQVIERSDFVWSLSKLTLPHSLVRVIIAEQWYRINCIYNQHPYHK